LRVGGGQGLELVGAVQQVGDGPLGPGEAASGEFAVEFGDDAGLGVAEASDKGEDVEAELLVRQGEGGAGPRGGRAGGSEGRRGWGGVAPPHSKTST
jgi:hypothetical protein